MKAMSASAVKRHRSKTPLKGSPDAAATAASSASVPSLATFTVSDDTDTVDDAAIAASLGEGLMEYITEDLDRDESSADSDLDYVDVKTTKSKSKLSASTLAAGAASTSRSYSPLADIKSNFNEGLLDDRSLTSLSLPVTALLDHSPWLHCVPLLSYPLSASGCISRFATAQRSEAG